MCAAMSDNRWVPAFPLDASLEIQIQDHNLWKEGGEPWFRFEGYKTAASVQAAQIMGATDKDLKKLVISGNLAIKSPSGEWVSYTKDAIGEKRHALERSPLSEMDQAPTKLARATESMNLEDQFEAVQDPEPDTKTKKGGNSEPTNADIMSRLEIMMQNMVMKEDMANLKKDVTQQAKIMIAEAVDPLKEGISDVKQNVAGIDRRLSVVEHRSGGEPADRSVQDKITALEAQLKSLCKSDFAMVIGGLHTSASEADAIKFVEDQLHKVGAKQPTSTYVKVTYNGFVCAKYAAKADKDDSIERLRKAGVYHNGSKAWVDEERPKEERAVRGFLFGLKKILVDWDWQKMSIWADTDTGVIYLGDDAIATVSVKEENILDIKYEEGWEEYLRDPAVDALKESSQKKLSAGGKKGAGKKGAGRKGAGKTKSKGTSQ